MTDESDEVGPFIETAPEGFVLLGDGSYVWAEDIIRVAPAGESMALVHTSSDVFEVPGEAYEIALAASEARRKPEKAPNPNKPARS